VLSVGTFVVSRHVTDRQEERLLALQARDARTSLVATIRQFESGMASVGSVAMVTEGDPAALDRLIRGNRSLAVYSALAVLRKAPDGSVAVAAMHGTPTADPTRLPGDVDARLRGVFANGGIDVIGFFGSGPQRRLAAALGPPAVPPGYVVYAEVPVPEGAVEPDESSRLDIALYAGPTEDAPMLFATTGELPLRGERVRELVDLNEDLRRVQGVDGAGVLLFVAATDGPLIGRLAFLLPWLLGTAILVSGLLAAAVVQSTLRRRDEAMSLVARLEERNVALDRAMAEQAEAEEARARLEDELRQSQRLEAVGQLAGGVAHDFNNLLAVILIYSDFVSRALGDHPAQADIDEIRKAAQRAVDLTRQLLIFSRRELVEPTVVDVNDAVSGLLDMLSRTLGEQVDLRATLAPGLPRVLADRGELEQVLVNLAVNARDAVTGHGTITVATAEEVVEAEGAAVRGGLRPGRYVRLDVSDDGTGMTPEVAGRVFEPFFTTKEPGLGTGLGLATVFGIACRFGGHVTVDTTPGAGSTFHVYLPATDEVPEVEAPTPPPPADETTGETVLVVEDEPAVRNATRRILQGAGYRVLEAADGQQALAEWSDGAVDLLLTDVVMPGGLSGRELADRLQGQRPGLRVLFMSGYTADTIATRGVLDPGIAVIHKPFTSAELLAKVREVLSTG
jgi:signal transduction histidine kinase